MTGAAIALVAIFMGSRPRREPPQPAGGG
jgi:hypothetical protein